MLKLEPGWKWTAVLLSVAAAFLLSSCAESRIGTASVGGGFTAGTVSTVRGQQQSYYPVGIVLVGHATGGIWFCHEAYKWKAETGFLSYPAANFPAGCTAIGKMEATGKGDISIHDGGAQNVFIVHGGTGRVVMCSVHYPQALDNSDPPGGTCVDLGIPKE
jgi:hypothetical protein